MWTELVGDHLSRGIDFMGIVCPMGQEVGDRKSGDQMGSGPNGFRTKCVAAGESTNTYYGILKSSHGYFPSIVIRFGSMCNAARRLFPTKLINVRSSNHPKEKGENFPTGLSFMEKQFE